MPLVNPYRGKPKKYKNYIKEAIGNLRLYLKNFEIIEEIHKIDFKEKLSYTLKVKGFQPPYDVIIQLNYILHEQRSYALYFFADKVNFNEISPMFEEMLHSFTLFPPQRMTKEFEMQKRKRETLASIDIASVAHEINNINTNTNIDTIHNLIEVFSLAGLMDDTMGFGNLNHLYPKFRANLIQANLMDAVPGEMYRTLMMFEEIARSHGLIE